jgi:transcriptional regulator with XRE-family HTH domain
LGIELVTRKLSEEDDARLMALRQRLSAIRQNQRMTVEAAASKLNLSRVQMWRIETSQETKLTVKRLLEIADLYGVDAGTLLSESASVAPTPATFEWIAQAIIAVEEMLIDSTPRPSPDRIAETVLSIIEQESVQKVKNSNHVFDPSQYRRMLKALGTGAPPPPVAKLDP